MQSNATERNIHRVFEVSIVLKALHGLLEVALGVLLFFPVAITTLVYVLTQNELVEDPNDFLARTFAHIIPFISGPNVGSFAAYYLLIHGAVKLFLVIFLFQKKLWAYPLTEVTLIFFIAYQIYRYTYTHSPMLLVLTAFDILVMWLVWHEYQYLKEHHAFPE